PWWRGGRAWRSRTGSEPSRQPRSTAAPPSRSNSVGRAWTVVDAISDPSGGWFHHEVGTCCPDASISSLAQAPRAASYCPHPLPVAPTNPCSFATRNRLLAEMLQIPQHVGSPRHYSG